MSKLIVTFLFVCSIMALKGQSDSLSSQISAMSISIEDDFTSWDLYGVEESPIGNIKLRWPTQSDWTEWDYRIEITYLHLKLCIQEISTNGASQMIAIP